MKATGCAFCRLGLCELFWSMVGTLWEHETLCVHLLRAAHVLQLS